jgi:hypothetical protein
MKELGEDLFLHYESALRSLVRQREHENEDIFRSP